MKPITFCCEQIVDMAPEAIARQILDLNRWPDFRGFGPIPGIRLAALDFQTPETVGSRIRVTNTDGSTHVEEIVEWQTDHRLRLHMKDFSAPLSHLATGIDETWDFERIGDQTKITRSLRLHAKYSLAWPLLWVISLLLKKAIVRHLRAIRNR